MSRTYRRQRGNGRARGRKRALVLGLLGSDEANFYGDRTNSNEADMPWRAADRMLGRFAPDAITNKLVSRFKIQRKRAMEIVKSRLQRDGTVSWWNRAYREGVQREKELVRSIAGKLDAMARRPVLADAILHVLGGKPMENRYALARKYYPLLSGPWSAVKRAHRDGKLFGVAKAAGFTIEELELVIKRSKDGGFHWGN